MGWISHFLLGAVLGGVLNSLPQTSIPMLIVGVISIALLLFFLRYLPNISLTMVVVVLGILVSALMGLEKYGVSIVGPGPTGLSSLVRPTLPPVSLTLEDNIYRTVRAAVAGAQKSVGKRERRSLGMKV